MLAKLYRDLCDDLSAAREILAHLSLLNSLAEPQISSMKLDYWCRYLCQLVSFFSTNPLVIKKNSSFLCLCQHEKLKALAKHFLVEKHSIFEVFYILSSVLAHYKNNHSVRASRFFLVLPNLFTLRYNFNLECRHPALFATET